MALVTAAVCRAAIIAIAAQNRGFDVGRPISRLVSALDADRDAVISAAETRSAPSALRSLDANGDGRVAPDELPCARDSSLFRVRSLHPGVETRADLGGDRWFAEQVGETAAPTGHEIGMLRGLQSGTAQAHGTGSAE